MVQLVSRVSPTLRTIFHKQPVVRFSRLVGDCCNVVIVHDKHCYCQQNSVPLRSKTRNIFGDQFSSFSLFVSVSASEQKTEPTKRQLLSSLPIESQRTSNAWRMVGLIETYLAFGKRSDKSEDDSPQPPVPRDASGDHVAWVHGETQHAVFRQSPTKLASQQHIARFRCIVGKYRPVVLRRWWR